MKVATTQTESKEVNGNNAKPQIISLKPRKARRKANPLPNQHSRPQTDETGKLSIAQCKAILCRDGAEYSDEQVTLIRQVLYTLAEVDYKYHCNLKKQQTATIIQIHTTDNEQQNSYSLHPRIYGRTG